MAATELDYVFFPYHMDQVQRVIKNELCFSHYTQAATALKIIQNQEIWLRNVMVMNDSKEFEHGKDLLCNLIENSIEGNALREAFNIFSPGLFDEVFSNFKDWGFFIKNDQFISCFSEHLPEDDLGTLSMWRAYGGRSGVSIVFEQELFFNSPPVTCSFSSVAYLSEKELKDEIANLATSISTNLDLIKTVDTKKIGHMLFDILRLTALCNKHQGFQEEKEWRLIMNPSVLTEKKRHNTEHITYDIETINGTPQKILKLKFSSMNWGNKRFKDMIKRIIIGPCEHPWITYESFVMLLRDLDIEHPEKIVQISEIPLRV